MDYNFPYWGPFVLKTQVNDEVVNILLKKGNESREKNLDARIHLAGMLDNEFSYEDAESWFIPMFDEYLHTYMKTLEENWVHHAAYLAHNLDKFGWKLDALWINYQKALEYNPPHNHKADLSFIIYLQVPDEIRIENERMEGVRNNDGPGTINFTYGIGVDLPFAICKYITVPSVHDVYIFPGWLIHYVHSFKSDVERISVSGNIFLNKNEN